MEAAGNSQSASIFKRLIRPQAWPAGALSIPKYQAHRGFWKSGVRENTLLSFRAARAAGATMSELDVQLSKDGVPVVFHDDDISRFTDSQALVRELTATQLWDKVQAPTLEQVLADPQGTALYNIELKTRILLDEALERKVFAVIQKTQSQGRVLFSSFNPFSLLRMSLYTSEIPLALLVANDLEEKFLRELWFAPLLRLHLLHLQDEIALSEGELEFWSSRKMPVAVWTVNDQKKASLLLQRGALSIISDDLIK